MLGYSLIDKAELKKLRYLETHLTEVMKEKNDKIDELVALSIKQHREIERLCALVNHYRPSRDYKGRFAKRRFL